MKDPRIAGMYCQWRQARATDRYGRAGNTARFSDPAGNVIGFYQQPVREK
jgi:hypothetical protein